jgi:hypothetical protein
MGKGKTMAITTVYWCDLCKCDHFAKIHLGDDEYAHLDDGPETECPEEDYDDFDPLEVDDRYEESFKLEEV